MRNPLRVLRYRLTCGWSIDSEALDTTKHTTPDENFGTLIGAPRRVFESRGLYPDPIDLTNTGAEEYTKGTHRVPLRDVIGAAQVVLQTARLKVADALELAETLVSDLQAFDPKPIERNSDLRGGRNADLVLALAIALWWSDKLTWNDDVGRRRYEPKDARVSHWVA